jgi:hypothetical protein
MRSRAARAMLCKPALREFAHASRGLPRCAAMATPPAVTLLRAWLCCVAPGVAPLPPPPTHTHHHAVYFTPMDLRAFPFDAQQLLIQVCVARCGGGLGVVEGWVCVRALPPRCFSVSCATTRSLTH